MEPFIGQIMIVGFNFAPRGWAFCDGQLLTVYEYPELFSLLGTMYGGDGRSTFGLPNLKGRVPMHFDGYYYQGLMAGSPSNILTEDQMPSHNHNATGQMKAAYIPPTGFADKTSPAGHNLGVPSGNTKIYSSSDANNLMAEDNVNITIENSGNNAQINNLQPFTVMNFIIALEGLYPSRS